VINVLENHRDHSVIVGPSSFLGLARDQVSREIVGSQLFLQRADLATLPVVHLGKKGDVFFVSQYLLESVHLCIFYPVYAAELFVHPECA
jgi:hypothetical protein